MDLDVEIEIEWIRVVNSKTSAKMEQTSYVTQLTTGTVITFKVPIPTSFWPVYKHVLSVSS